MLKQIQNKTLDKLDNLIARFSQQHAANNLRDNTEGIAELRSIISTADSQVASVLSDQKSISASPKKVYSRIDSKDLGKYSNFVLFDSSSIFVFSI